jgi:hypothetical protein
LQDQISRAQESLDEHRSLLAEKLQQFEGVADSLSALETEVSSIQRTFDSMSAREKEQRDYIDSLLFLCKGSLATPSEPERMAGTQYLEQLTEKTSLLSTLERENENILSTARDKENEKLKLSLSIREGLQIGQRYKELLVTMSRESEALEEERIAGTDCLNECRQNLQFALERVAEKVRLYLPLLLLVSDLC